MADYDAATNTTTVANHIQYDAFGNIVAESNPAIDFRYAYTGRAWDADAQMYYYRARWYDPATGRFASEDPLGLAPDTNPYRYVSNGPTNFVDPSGLRQHSTIPEYGYELPLNPITDADVFAAMARMEGGGINDVRGFTDDPLDWMFGGGGQEAHIWDIHENPLWTDGVGAGIRDVVGDDHLLNAGGWQLLGETVGVSIVAGTGIYFGAAYVAPAAGSALTAAPTITLPSLLATTGAGELAVVGGGTIVLPSALEVGGVAAIGYAASALGPLNSLMSKNYVEADIEISKLTYPSSQPYAEPWKLKRHGPFDWNKYDPITVQTDGIRYWLQNGVTRCDNAIKAGILKLPARIFTR